MGIMRIIGFICAIGFFITYSVIMSIGVFFSDLKENRRREQYLQRQYLKLRCAKLISQNYEKREREIERLLLKGIE